MASILVNRAVLDQSEVFILNGNLNDSLTVPIINLNTQSTRVDKKLNRKLSYFTVECFQNIIRHGQSDNKEVRGLKSGMFAFSKNGSSISLSTSNLIETDKVSDLAGKLDHLISLDTEELKSLYITVLNNSEISILGGAGLGLIDVLRKAKGNIEYMFTQKNDDLSNFLFETKIEQPNEESNSFKARDYQEFMDANNLLLYRKGSISSDSFLSLCQVITAELTLNKSNRKDTELLVILELLQNVCTHKLVSENSEDCMFLREKSKGVFDFYTGNTISNDSIAFLEEKLTAINQLSEEELNEEYLSSLSELIESPENKLELGWIKIRRRIKSQLIFSFEEINREISIFYVGFSF